MVEERTTIMIFKDSYNRLDKMKGKKGNTRREEPMYSVVKRLLDHWDKTHKED